MDNITDLRIHSNDRTIRPSNNESRWLTVLSCI